MATDRLLRERVWKTTHPKVKREFFALKDNVQVIDGEFYTANGVNVSHMLEINMKVTDKQVKGLNTVEEMAEHETANGGFVFAFFNACKTMEEQFPTLSQSDLARVLLIGTYAGWSTGELKHDNGVAITKKSLAEVLGMSRSKFSEFYKKAIEAGILAEMDGSLFVNPKHFFRGNLSEIKHLTKDVQYTRVFRQTVRELYDMYNGRSIKQLALIYAVLPFINFKFNIIAYNTDEYDSAKIRHIPLEKLASLLGYQNATKLKAALNKIKYEGQSVFGFFEKDGDRRQRKVVVNPRVIYAGNGKSLDTISALFN